MRFLSTLVLIAALGAGSVKAQASSLTTFAVANNFCEKARLGMEPIAAYQQALSKVKNRQVWDADYELPNWNKLVSNEMHRLCPSEYAKLVKALAAKAAARSKWDALPESEKAKERAKEQERAESLRERQRQSKCRYFKKSCQLLELNGLEDPYCSSYVSELKCS